MGLSASMWTSVSGLLSHGNKMNVVGNNIANVSTIGFKSQRMDFNDYLYINGSSTSGATQIGAGVSTYAVLGDFSQGSLESTNSVTDLAIDGKGFFKVRKPNSDQMYYSRAGDFYINQNRELQNPEGYKLQGWKVDSKTRLTFKGNSVKVGAAEKNESAFVGTGSPKDIVLDSWYLEPQRTTNMTFVMGLTADGKHDKTTSNTHPMSALFDQWDARKNPPMPAESFATQSSIKVFDEAGNQHTATVYYDQIATNNGAYTIQGLPAGYTMYEYVVTIPPAEDLRSFGGTQFNPDTNTFDGNPPTKFYDPPNRVSEKAGILMTGQLIFDAGGNLVNQSAYTYAAQTNPQPGNQADMDPDQRRSWQATKFSSNGLPVFTANFTGQPLANSVSERMTATRSQAENYIVELDLGLKNLGNWKPQGRRSLNDMRVQGHPGVIDYNTSMTLFESGVRVGESSAANNSSFITQNSKRDGYASGILGTVDIDPHGVVSGVYDNGVTIPLYQIAMYDFHNHQGLYREGGNLFSATRDSGQPRQGVAGDAGFGSVRAFNIENSNVDMTREFVQMITTQRGFQANSKGITTVDTMLETVIGMKR